MAMVQARAAGIGRSDRLRRSSLSRFPIRVGAIPTITCRRLARWLTALLTWAFCPDDDRESLAGPGPKV